MSCVRSKYEGSQNAIPLKPMKAIVSPMKSVRMVGIRSTSRACASIACTPPRSSASCSGAELDLLEDVEGFGMFAHFGVEVARRPRSRAPRSGSGSRQQSHATMRPGTTMTRNAVRQPNASPTPPPMPIPTPVPTTNATRWYPKMRPRITGAYESASRLDADGLSKCIAAPSTVRIRKNIQNATAAALAVVNTAQLASTNPSTRVRCQ